MIHLLSKFLNKHFKDYILVQNLVVNVKIKLALSSNLLSSPAVAWKKLLEKVEQSDEDMNSLNRSGYHGCGWSETILLEDEDDRQRSKMKEIHFNKEIKY